MLSGIPENFSDAYRNCQMAGQDSVPVHQISHSSNQGACVQVSVYPHPGGFIVHRVEGVQLVVEEQQLLAVGAGRAVNPLLLPVNPAKHCRVWQASQHDGK